MVLKIRWKCYNYYEKEVVELKIVKILALIGVIAMSVALFNGFYNGSFSEDGGALMQNPWGIVSLVDLYVGFVLFSIWIVYRETSRSQIIVWVVLMMILGFFTASVYVLYALHQSKDDVLTFIHGRHAKHYQRKDNHEQV